ncbi:MAG: aldolase/citrate lyase family protein, partial [Dehalococcoidia bacterium]|nr:aldolase/citrate lyase family protein [Dehalococcoidia bacterium]
VLDAEHGHITPQVAYGMVLAAEGSGVCPLVRIPTIDEGVIQTYLDLGAAGLFVPRVETRDDLARIEAASYYYPLGQRGLGHVRSGRYGYHDTLKEYMTKTNEMLVLIVQVETARSLELLETMATDPLVDGIFVGATDLSQSMGHPGEIQHPEIQAAIRRTIETVGGRKPLGMSVRDPDGIAAAVSRGFRLILANFHGVVRIGASQYRKSFAEARGAYR